MDQTDDAVWTPFADRGLITICPHFFHTHPPLKVSESADEAKVVGVTHVATVVDFDGKLM
jgi:hypothetical protein